MSIKSLRARAAAALRRASKNASTRVQPRKPEPWKIETLEPKLLLSADALPAVHLLATQSESTAPKVYGFERGEGVAWVDARAAGDDMPGLLQLGDGIAPSDLAVRRVVDDATGEATALELALRGTADRVQIRGFFTDANPVQAVACRRHAMERRRAARPHRDRPAAPGARGRGRRSRCQHQQRPGQQPLPLRPR